MQDIFLLSGRKLPWSSTALMHMPESPASLSPEDNVLRNLRQQDGIRHDPMKGDRQTTLPDVKD